MKINDKVKIKDFGKTYTTYDDMFKKMGFKNTKENYYELDWSKRIFTIFAKKNNLLGIKDTFGNELLISEDGLKLANPTFEYLEEVEVSDDGKTWYQRQFLCNLPNGEFLTWNSQWSHPCDYKKIRKLNTERTQAIETIKELMSNHKIEKSEL